MSTTVTGIAVPSLDARIAARLGLRPDVKRIPIMGLGCVAGAAGIARLHDYLRGRRDRVAVLVSVELCSLTIQRGDPTAANMVASGLFGDGAAAVVAGRGERAAARYAGPAWSTRAVTSIRTPSAPWAGTSGHRAEDRARRRGARFGRDAISATTFEACSPTHDLTIDGRRRLGVPSRRSQGHRGDPVRLDLPTDALDADLAVAGARSATCRPRRCCTSCATRSSAGRAGTGGC